MDTQLNISKAQVEQLAKISTYFKEIDTFTLQIQDGKIKVGFDLSDYIPKFDIAKSKSKDSLSYVPYNEDLLNYVRGGKI
tara:strand:- start:343 stop:582 length:240 start_codon:yes stop_codon:yes gene_type:complete